VTWTMVFPLLVGLLELFAAIVYAYDRQWWLAMSWFFYALACVGLAMAGR
jgi:hypothetical protein